MGYRQRFGTLGEELAAEYIRQLDMAIIDRNWRIREGEIDLIAQEQDGRYIFIEVKIRSSLHYGHPLEAISPTKALRLQRLALAWLATHSSWGATYRIDCLGITPGRDGEWSFDYRMGVL